MLLGLPRNIRRSMELSDAWVCCVACEERALLPRGSHSRRPDCHARDLELVTVGVLNGVHGDGLLVGCSSLGSWVSSELARPMTRSLLLEPLDESQAVRLWTYLLNDVAAARPRALADERRGTAALPPADS